MTIQWYSAMKLSFQNEWQSLPPKELHQVLKKITRFNWIKSNTKRR